MESTMNVTTAGALVRAAEIIARKAHTGQKREIGEDSGKPYIIHPERMAAKFCKETYPVQHAAAWLHDVLEDTSVTANDLINEGISDEVIAVVRTLTHQVGEKYVDYIRRILCDPNARAVKREDLLDNMQSLNHGSLRDKYELALFILDNV